MGKLLCENVEVVSPKNEATFTPNEKETERMQILSSLLKYEKRIII